MNKHKCALPSNTLLGSLIAVVLNSVLCLIVLVVARLKTKAKVRQVLNWATAVVIFNMCNALSIYLEGGAFAAAPIFLMVMTDSAIIWATHVSEVSLGGTFALANTDLT